MFDPTLSRRVAALESAFAQVKDLVTIQVVPPLRDDRDFGTGMVLALDESLLEPNLLLGVTTAVIPAAGIDVTVLTTTYGSIDGAAASVTVADFSLFTNLLPFVVALENELLLVIDADQNSLLLNVVRGFADTTATSHASGTLVRQVDILLGASPDLNLGRGPVLAYQIGGATDGVSFDLKNAGELVTAYNRFPIDIPAGMYVQLFLDKASDQWLIADVVWPTVYSVDDGILANGTYSFRGYRLAADGVTWIDVGLSFWGEDLAGSTSLTPGTKYTGEFQRFAPGGRFLFSIQAGNQGHALTDPAWWIAATTPLNAIPAYQPWIVASIAIADGSQTIAAQPVSPSQLVLQITDANASITAGVYTIVGTDPNSVSITETISIANGGTKNYLTAYTYKTVVSITLAGSSGETGVDFLKVVTNYSPAFYGNLLTFGGHTYLCNVPFTTEEPGSGSDWTDLGTGALVNKGALDANTTYAVGQYGQEVRAVMAFESDVDAASASADDDSMFVVIGGPGGGGTPGTCCDGGGVVAKCYTPYIWATMDGDYPSVVNSAGPLVSAPFNPFIQPDGSIAPLPALFELYGGGGNVSSGGHQDDIHAPQSGAGGGGTYSAALIHVYDPPYIATFTLSGGLVYNGGTSGTIITVKSNDGTTVIQGDAGHWGTGMKGGLPGLAANCVGDRAYDGGRGGDGAAWGGGGGGAGAGPNGPGGNGQNAATPGVAALGGIGYAPGGDGEATTSSPPAGQPGTSPGGGCGGIIIKPDGSGSPGAIGTGYFKVSFGTCAVLPTLATGGATASKSIPIWVNNTVSGAANTIQDQQNISDVAYNAAGNYTVTFAVSFASAESFTWAGSAVGTMLKEVSRTSSTVRVATDSGTDPTRWGIIVQGNLLAGTGGGPGTIGSSGPTVNLNTAVIAITATTFNITGSGFNSTAGSNTVLMSLGAKGTVTSVSGTTGATITFSTPPQGNGTLTLILNNGVASSGAAVQVATVGIGVLGAPTVTNTSGTDIGLFQTIITITGTGYSPTPSANLVTFTTLSVVGIVTASTITSLTVQLSALPSGAGSLSAYVTVNGGQSNTDVVATVISGPTVTPSGTAVDINAGTITIDGTGFDSGTPSNNVVTFDNGAEGTVTAATSTSLAVTMSTHPVIIGPLSASVAVSGVSSGAMVPIATITAVPHINTNLASIGQLATSVTFTGVNFGAVQGSGPVGLNVMAGGRFIAMPILAWSDTSITVSLTIRYSIPTSLIGFPLLAHMMANGQSSNTATIGIVVAGPTPPPTVYTVEFGTVNGHAVSATFTPTGADSMASVSTLDFGGSESSALAYHDTTVTGTTCSISFTATNDLTVGTSVIMLILTRWDHTSGNGYGAYIFGQTLYVVEINAFILTLVSGGASLTLTNGNTYTATTTDSGTAITVTLIDDVGTQSNNYTTSTYAGNTEVAFGFILNGMPGSHTFTPTITGVVP